MLCYPLLVHATVVTDSSTLAFAALVVLGCNLLAPWLGRGQAWATAALAAVVVASLGFVMLGESRAFLYAAPVLIALAMLWLFARTLLPGQKALVTRIAEAIRGPLPEPVRRYTRRVTQFWVVAFAVLALTNLLLALLAPPVLWSLFTNFINYLLVAVVFVAEWLVRCRALRGYESMTWREYASALLRLDYRHLTT